MFTYSKTRKENRGQLGFPKVMRMNREVSNSSIILPAPFQKHTYRIVVSKWLLDNSLLIYSAGYILSVGVVSLTPPSLAA